MRVGVALGPASVARRRVSEVRNSRISLPSASRRLVAVEPGATGISQRGWAPVASRRCNVMKRPPEVMVTPLASSGSKSAGRADASVAFGFSHSVRALVSTRKSEALSSSLAQRCAGAPTLGLPMSSTCRREFPSSPSRSSGVASPVSLSSASANFTARRLDRSVIALVARSGSASASNGASKRHSGPWFLRPGRVRSS